MVGVDDEECTSVTPVCDKQNAYFSQKTGFDISCNNSHETSIPVSLKKKKKKD